ncbi:MAG: hypothetical protein AAF525_01840, partial [Pseudomonadota bacterium]
AFGLGSGRNGFRMRQDFNEDLQESREQDKIYRALKYELEGFRFLMPGQAGYTTGIRNQMQRALGNGRVTDFSEWRFIAPQYDYQIIEYAINVQNSEIVDFALFERLKVLFTSIKRLEDAESHMMLMAQRYQAIPVSLDADSDFRRIREADNQANLKRFLVYMGDRINNLERVAEISGDVLSIVNEGLSQDVLLEIETELVRKQIHLLPSEEAAVVAAAQYFPGFDPDLVRAIFRESRADDD